MTVPRPPYMPGSKELSGEIHEPDCRLVVIPNASHAANLDNPGFFHKVLMDFPNSHCR